MKISLNIDEGDKDVINYDEIDVNLSSTAVRFKSLFMTSFIFPRFLREGCELYNIWSKVSQYSSILYEGDKSGKHILTSEKKRCITLLHHGCDFLEPYLKRFDTNIKYFNIYVVIYYIIMIISLYYIIFKIIF